MYIGFYSHYEVLNKNMIFTNPFHACGDNSCYPMIYLARHLKNIGHKICTIDLEYTLEKFDAIIFRDLPKLEDIYFLYLLERKFDNLYLLINECEVILPDNWDVKNHACFKKILTWHDRWVDNIKYFKFHTPVKVPPKVEFDLGQKNKFCTMIQSGDKFNFHPLSLQFERRKAIRWFEQNHPEDFDLYGYRWDNTYPSHRGSVNTKREVMQRYRFSICYENARDLPGYITEKIFDCFFAGNVPIYWGPPNITPYIPAETYIDKTNFKSYEELYKYLKGMPEAEYVGYLDAIKRYVTGDRIYRFTPQAFANTIMELLGI
ncbi:MAG: glycosyltransferase family 10 domain-containing protein [Bacillota bacterium]